MTLIGGMGAAAWLHWLLHWASAKPEHFVAAMILRDALAHPTLLPGIWIVTVPATVVVGMLACAMNRRLPFWAIVIVAAAEVVRYLAAPVSLILLWWVLRRRR